MVYRFMFFVAAAGMLSLLTGCALVDRSKAASRSAWKHFKPRSTDYRDATQEEDDKWGFVGKIARGDRPLENENDPLKELTMSPKARSIERSLGYE